MAIRLDLPLPPSTNALWRRGTRKGKPGMIKSKAYAAWIEQAGWQLLTQRPAPIDGDYHIALYLPANVRGDIDNRIKAASDLLVTHKLIDDAKAASVSISRVKDILSGMCRVLVIDLVKED